MPVLDFGGVESRIVTQSALMDRERFDFRVCTFWKKGNAAARIEATGVEVDELGIDPSPLNPRATARLAAYVRSNGFEVIHASILEANFHAALLRAIPGAPSVAIEEVGMPRRRLHGRVGLGAVYRLADVVVGVSEKTCAALRQEHWLPLKKTRLIYNAVNPEFLEAVMPPTVRPRLRLLAVGRLVEVKNHAVLLRALASLPASERPELRIAGEGPLHSELEGLRRELRLEESVQFLGFRQDVKALLDDSDVYVLPSFSEGTSISLAEAMARARPVVVSRADGIDEAMTGYPEGWQLDPRDSNAWAEAIRRMSELNDDARRGLGEYGRATVAARMSPLAWRQSLEGMYQELAERTRGRWGSLLWGVGT